MPDREKVIRHFQDAIVASGSGNRWRFVRVDIIEDAIAMLKEQDDCENCAIAIEDRQLVVRCKDCKHYNPDTQSCNDGLDGIFLPDWFCADGERR